LRRKYWQIYYGDDQFECRSAKFISAESKRLSTVSKRVKELNNEQRKQSSRHQELDELNRITIHNAQQLSPDLSTGSFLHKFRRSRSTSNPCAFNSDDLGDHRSFDILCQTPLCKPPAITFTKYP